MLFLIQNIESLKQIANSIIAFQQSNLFKSLKVIEDTVRDDLIFIFDYAK